MKTLREMMDIIESAQTVAEFAPGGGYQEPPPPVTKKKDPWDDDDRSIYPRKIQQLLAAGNTVDSRVPGAQGHVFQADDRAIRMKRLNKPYSQKKYAWYISADRDETLVLKQVKPGHYVLYDRQWMPQGPVSESAQTGPLAQVGDTVVYHDFTGFKQKKSVIVSIHKRPEEDAGYQYQLKNGDLLDDLSFTEPGGAEIQQTGVSESDETSWTANSAKFGQEEPLRWTVRVAIDPRDDMNKGRGAQVKTLTVSALDKASATKKVRSYFMKNGWAVTNIEFVDSEEQLEETTDEAVAKVEQLFKDKR
jgi:hypothetical protein